MRAIPEVRIRATARTGPGWRRTRIGVAVAAALAAGPVPRAALADDAAATAGPPAPAGGGLAEVLVTARKQQENLQDVPLSLSVFSADDLKKLSITQFEDYASRDPAISYTSAGPGTQVFVIRGVSDGSNPEYSNSSLTGFFVDDVALSSGSTQPDIHLYDLERIEVLKGPQGTTFGAGSMSGAVRYITNKPDVNAFAAGVDVDGAQIQAGGQNYTGEGFLNLPLIDGTFGLRMSVYDSVHGGFIDNRLVTRQWLNGVVSNNAAYAGNDYNTQHTKGTRIALKYVANDRWSATVTYQYQEQIARGSWDQLPAVWGEDAVARFGPELHHNDLALVDGNLQGDIGIADLVFASSYWNYSTRQLNEYSEYMQYANVPGKITAPWLQGFTCQTGPTSVTQTSGFNYSGCSAPLLYYNYKTYERDWTDELRLSSKPGGRLHWLAGLYWEHDESQSSNDYTMPGLNVNGQTFQSAASYYASYYGGALPKPPPQTWYAYLSYGDYQATTEFANVNFDVTDKLNVELGVVHFRSEFSSHSPYTAYAYYWYTQPGQIGGPTATNGGNQKWDSRAGVNYKPVSNLLLYATFSQGFRDGGSNAGYPSSCYAAGVPDTYQPDTLNNYELGWKSTLLEHRLVWNGSLYYMPWKNFQTSVYDPAVCAAGSFNANLGDARVYGGETNVDLKLNDHWSLQGAMNYTDAELTSNSFNNPSFQLPPGSRLPYAPYFNWSANVRYETHVMNGLIGYAQYDVAYKGDMYNNLTSSTGNGFPRVLQPPYGIMDLRLGVNPEDEGWMAEVYVTNLANKNAVIFTNTYNYDFRETTNEPRAFGLRLNYRWGKKT